MSFDLEVTFRCLCFFVPDSEAKRMHVLMPDSTRHDHGAHGHAGHGHGANGQGGAPAAAAAIDPHVVRLVYPVHDGSGSLFGGTAGVKEMEGWQMVLPEGGSGVESTDLPPELLNLTDNGNTGPVPAPLLGRGADRRITSRIVIAAGRVKNGTAAATWDFEGTRRPMVQEVVWTIPGLPGEELTLRRTRIRPTGQGDEESWTVRPTDGLLKLTVHHVMADDFPTPRTNTDPRIFGPHYEIYYDLFDVVHRRGKPSDPVKVDETNTVNCIASSGKPAGSGGS